MPVSADDKDLAVFGYFSGKRKPHGSRSQNKHTPIFPIGSIIAGITADIVAVIVAVIIAVSVLRHNR